MADSAFHEVLDQVRPEIEGALDRFLPAAEAPPERLHAAMRYSVFAGGKRVRPALVLLAGELFGAPRSRLLPAAAAIEMVHTFSLIHDDLPALDDDDLRRGRPTLHREYDEALAVLAGDALLNLGLGLVTAQPSSVPAEVRVRATGCLVEAVGTVGMIGGQVADLEAERRWPEQPEVALESIHRRKTGALIVASLRIGGMYGGADAENDALLRGVGEGIGLSFQIADDILDVEGNTESLGKTAGKDARAHKLTYPAVHGLPESRRRLLDARDRTIELAQRLPDGGGVLPVLVEWLASRDH